MAGAAPAARPGAPTAGPLEGLRVVELTTTVAGPYCGRLLADFGADVIKIEPLEGDAVRTMGLRKEGRSLYGVSILRGKRLVALDLRKPAGRDAARRLVDRADVVIENFRPGTLESWGLGYADVARDNPGVVYVRISGYGQSGPYRERPGYGITCEAVSGLRELIGDPERAPPRVNVSLTDEVAGLYGAFGALIALNERARTGRGQVVDVALYEAAFSLIEQHVPAFAALGVVAKRTGARLANTAPNNLYATADGRFVQITAITQGLFARLARVMGAPELLDDPRFADPLARARNVDALDAAVGRWTGAHALAEVESRLIEAGIPAARIYDMADVFADPHYRERAMLVEVDDDALGPVTVPGVVPKLDATPGAVRWAGRQVGADTRAVLAEVAGMSAEEIERLLAEGAIGTDEAGGAVPG